MTPEFHFTIDTAKQTIKLKQTRKSKMKFAAVYLGVNLVFAAGFWLMATASEARLEKNYEEKTLDFPQ